ncbi:hypothetical protein D9M68_822930 [compost metagenome]
MARSDGHRLGQIDGRSPAHGNNAIATARLQGFDARAYRRFGRVGRRLVENGALLAEYGLDLADDAGRFHALVRHDARFRNAQLAADLFQFSQGACAETHFGHVIDQSHIASSLKQFAKGSLGRQPVSVH